TDGGLMGHVYGFDQGFDQYRDERKPDHDQNGFRKISRPMHQWIREHAGQDFFLFVHTYDTHAPYSTPDPFVSRFQDAPPLPEKDLPEASLLYCAMLDAHGNQKLSQYETLQDLVDRYDGCIAYVDSEISKLFQVLKEERLWDDSMIVITSDHGEQFMESGLMIGHGLSIENELVRVPLLIKLPGFDHAGRRVSHVVESVDIMPTIAAALDIPIPSEVQGQNLLAGLDEGRWTKSYAYGQSPCTGGNRFLLTKGVKYNEAVRDPDRNLIRHHLRPMTPPGASLPEDRKDYWAQDHRLFWYDFDEDPLGLDELFNTGDRLFNLKRAFSERSAEAIDDQEIKESFKTAIEQIAAESVRLNAEFHSPDSEEDALTNEAVEELNALGYAGLFAHDKTAADESPQAFDAGTSRRGKGVVDRHLLNKGDEFLWQMYRVIYESGVEEVEPEKMASRVKALGEDDLASGIEAARESYSQFLELFPEKKKWVQWRLWCLDQIYDMGIIQSLDD
ncbi:MAG: sulfatase-like hydrolase/transferase, partial [Planctomycetota bacterium]